MHIQSAARLTRLTPKAIRYYEQLGLVVPAKRPDNGYRHYSRENLDQLCFLQHARAVGFSAAEAGQLLELYRSKQSQSVQVKQLVADKLAWLATRRAEIERLEATLEDLWSCCNGDNRHQCAILDRLAGSEFHPEACDE